MRRYKSVKIRTKCAFCDMLYNTQTYRITQFQLLYLNKNMDKTFTFKTAILLHNCSLINDDTNNDNERLPDYRITGLPDYRITGLKKNLQQNINIQIQLSFHIRATTEY